MTYGSSSSSLVMFASLGGKARGEDDGDLSAEQEHRELEKLRPAVDLLRVLTRGGHQSIEHRLIDRSLGRVLAGQQEALRIRAESEAADRPHDQDVQRDDRGEDRQQGDR